MPFILFSVYIASGGRFPYYLQAAQVVIVPQSVCDGVYERYTDNMICASESLQLLGHVDTCQVSVNQKVKHLLIYFQNLYVVFV